MPTTTESDRSPYDPLPTDEADLWFLPPRDPLPSPAHRPIADRRALLDPREWRAAQADCAVELAALAYRFGQLSDRLRDSPPGLVQRLSLIEAVEIGWWSGDRITVDQLSLWLGLHQSTVQSDTLALQRAGWAVRRLSGGGGPMDGGWQTGLAVFLGRPDGDIADLLQITAVSPALHPAVLAAMLYQSWHMTSSGDSLSTAAGGTEAAVLAARTGACMGQGAPFLPLARSAALRATGATRDRLYLWLTGAETATRSALVLLDRLSRWEDKARDTLGDLQGRTPRALISAFADWPCLTSSHAEAVTGCSRAAVQRNLETMTARGLIREMTGLVRYRVWAARI